MRAWILAALVLLPGLPAMAAPLYTVQLPGADPLPLLPADSGPARVGRVLPFGLDSAHDGAWREEGMQRIWQAELLATGARFLSLQFQAASWPDGAELRLHGASGSQGPYRRQDLRAGRLWTALVLGERVTMEWRVPAGPAARVRLAAVHYGAVDPARAYQAKSGDCNIDVACSAAAGRANQIRSTVLLIFPVGENLIACSGFLVTNTRQDRTPYVLTAQHCEITADNAGAVQVYWKFQRNSCEQPGVHGHGSPDPSFSTTGTTVLADDGASDFSLLLLGEPGSPFVPPANYEPYWSGWNVGNSAAQSGVGVHHPSGNEKSISLFNSPAQAVVATIASRQISSWQVVWDQGTTEPGSSGSGLWDQSGLAVGVLSGGAASCSNSAGADFYGRLNVAWEQEAACERQLRHWLDPDNAGSPSVQGTDLNAGPAQPQVPACGGSPSPAPSATPSPTPSGGGSGEPPPGPIVTTPPPTPVPTPTPQPTATPVPTATPAPTPVVTPNPTVPPTPLPTPAAGGGGSGSPGGGWLGGLALLALWRRYGANVAQP